MAYHLEMYSLRSVPIIALINFLVGAIVTQQGIFQLARSARGPTPSIWSACWACANLRC